jgi:hypothetical protein
MVGLAHDPTLAAKGSNFQTDTTGFLVDLAAGVGSNAFAGLVNGPGTTLLASGNVGRDFLLVSPAQAGIVQGAPALTTWAR